MDIPQFWELIERTRLASNNDTTKQVELIIEELVKLTLQDILDYDVILNTFELKADRYDIKPVADLIYGGLGDSGWQDFLAWLVAQGQIAYESVLANPDNLVDIVVERVPYNPYPDNYYIRSEEMLLSWMRAYEQKTGDMNLEKYPAYEWSGETYDKGEDLWEDISRHDWETYYQHVKEKFPKTWARFGEGKQLY